MRIVVALCLILPVLCLSAGEALFPVYWSADRLPVRWRLEELQSPVDTSEAYQTVAADDARFSLTESRRELAGGAWEYQFVLQNRSQEALFLRPLVELEHGQAGARFWNGYLRPGNTQFDPGDKSLSTWFPAHAALADGRAVVLGINPSYLYSRVDSSLQAEEGKSALRLAFPVYLEPGRSFRYSFVLAAVPALHGYHDVVQTWYDLFSESFRPVAGVHPDLISSETGYLFWNAEKKGIAYNGDLIRRIFGGYGTWEWCYKPFVRGGDWAISDEWSVGWRGYTKERVEAARTRTRERLAPAERQLVAPMWYLNVKWTEWSIWEQHFPEIALQKEGNEKRKCWGQDTVLGVYSWGGAYGKLFMRSLEQIPREYPAAKGVAWDSCFGHAEIRADHAGFAETEPKSFYQRRPMALEAVGLANLLDFNHQQMNGERPMGNAVNFKLTSPYMLGVRTDVGLYEGNPMQLPERLMRIEAMRMRMGSPKTIAWHKHGGPDYMKWVDWADMSADEARDAYAQIADNTRFLSYYWGCIPAPHLPAMGIRSLCESLPELISLVRQGWQPSPAVGSGSADVLLARYGQGLGSRIVVIHSGFSEQEVVLQFSPDYWQQQGVWVVPEQTGLQTVSTLSASGTAVSLRVAPRSVTVLRVAALSALPATTVRIAGSRSAETGQLPFSRLLVQSAEGAALQPVFFRADAAQPMRLKVGLDIHRHAGGQGAVSLPLDTAKFTRDVQADNLLSEVVEVLEYPAYSAAELDVQTLLAMDLPGKAKAKQLQIVVPDEALHGEGARLAEWFGFQTLAAGAETLPEISRTGDGQGWTIVLSVQKEALKPYQKGIAFAEGTQIRLFLASPADATPMVLHFLRQLDAAYPYYGVLPAEEGFDRIGLAGQLLEPQPVRKPLRPNLREMMRRCSIDPAAP